MLPFMYLVHEIFLDDFSQNGKCPANSWSGCIPVHRFIGRKSDRTQKYEKLYGYTCLTPYVFLL